MYPSALELGTIWSQNHSAVAKIPRPFPLRVQIGNRNHLPPGQRSKLQKSNCEPTPTARLEPPAEVRPPRLLPGSHMPPHEDRVETEGPDRASGARYQGSLET